MKVLEVTLQVSLMDESSKEISSKYGLELMFVSRIFSRFISKIKIENLRRISIELVRKEDLKYTLPANVFTKVCVINTYLNWEEYDSLGSEIQKQNFLLDFILNTLIDQSEYDWPLEEFRKAYTSVNETNFVNEYLLLKEKKSNSRKFSAFVSVKVNKDNSDLILVVKSNKTLLKKIIIAKISVIYYDIKELANSLEWENDNEILVSNSEREIHYKYSLINDTIEVVITPKRHEREYLQDELILLNPDTNREVKIAIRDKRIEKLMR